MQRDKERHCCVICDDIISTENDSEEHVLTEAIGGRLTVKGFICRRCNNRAGHTWDAQLASQLHPLSLIFGVATRFHAKPCDHHHCGRTACAKRRWAILPD